MSYRLIVITHGRNEDAVERTLQSFIEHVDELPDERILVWDGGAGHRTEANQWFNEVIASDEQYGFCEATKTGWAVAAEVGADHIFWLEHDFLFLRGVPTRKMRSVLGDNPHLAQMSLLRQPANAVERAAGGLPNVTPEAWRRIAVGNTEWMEQDLYWTTNPSIFPRQLPVWNTWPEGPSCEGVFTHQLRNEKGYGFGVWGSGDPWVEHFGTRTGTGY